MLAELRQQKPDAPDIQSIEAMVPVLSQEERQKITAALQEMEIYRGNVAQEVDRLNAALQEYPQNVAVVTKYAKLPEDVSQVLKSGQDKIRAVDSEIARAKKILEAPYKDTREEIHLEGLIDPALIQKFQDAHPKVASVLKEARQIQNMETNCRKALEYLQKLQSELQPQREKVEGYVAKLQTEFSPSRGFRAVPARVAPFLQKVKQTELGLKEVTVQMDSALKLSQYPQYQSLLQRARPLRNLSLDSEMQGITKELEDVIAANQKKAETKPPQDTPKPPPDIPQPPEDTPQAALQQQRDAWQKENPDIGRKILGEWYAQLDPVLQSYQKISRRAAQHMKTTGARKIYFLLAAQVSSLQNFPRDITNMEWKLEKLVRTGMNLEETLVKKKATVILPAQIKQINAMRRYLNTRKFDVNMMPLVVELRGSVDKLVQETSEKSVKEETMREIYRTVQQLQENFWEYYRTLDAEVTNLETGEKN
jgi:hypothetical protein